MTSGRITALHAVTDPMSTILLRGQATYLKAKGFDVALLSSPGDVLQEIASKDGCATYAVPIKREISPLSDMLSLFRLSRLLRRLRPEICNSGTPKAGLLVGLAAYFVHVPCRIYTLRGLRLETATGFKRVLLTITEKLACSSAHRVICVSASLRERAINLRLVSSSKAILLGAGSSNGVDIDRFQPSVEKLARSADLRHALNIHPEQIVIGFAGRWTKDKGVPELVAAFQIVRKSIPQAVLLLVGDYEEGDPVPQQVRNIIELEPGIYRARFTSQIDLYYLAMDLFVLPTHREGFPNTVLEAQASGLPVITTRVTGAIDSIEDGVTGLLVVVENPQTLAEAILEILSDPAKMKRMGQLGRERVLDKFKNEMIWEELNSLYKEILEERGYHFTESVHAEDTPCAQAQ